MIDRFLDLALEPLEERYTRLDATTDRYESERGFMSHIERETAGMVEPYQGDGSDDHHDR